MKTAHWGSNRQNKDCSMDRDAYEQLMQMQISLDELEKKLDLVLDEIDELKESAEYKPRGNPEEKQLQQMQKNTKDPTYSKNSTSVSSVPKTLHRGFYTHTSRYYCIFRINIHFLNDFIIHTCSYTCSC